jgi:hypothetical protein
MVGNAAGLTVMVLVIGVNALPQASVAVHVSIIVPPQAPGLAERVERFDVPAIRHAPVNPLVKALVLGAGIAVQFTVTSAGGVIVGRGAGFTVMVRVTGVKALPQASVAFQVSMMVPPQAPEGLWTEKVDGLEVPLIRHPPAAPLVYGMVLGAGRAPQSTVISAGAVIVGSGAGLMVILRVTGAKALPHSSVAVHVSVTVPPQAPGMAENVERFDWPVIRQPPVFELVKVRILGSGSGSPQAIVIAAGAVIVGNDAGLIVIVRLTGARALPQASVAVQVSVTVPPQASGGIAENVEKFEFPLIRHPPAPPLV